MVADRSHASTIFDTCAGEVGVPPLHISHLRIYLNLAVFSQEKLSVSRRCQLWTSCWLKSHALFPCNFYTTPPSLGTTSSVTSLRDWTTSTRVRGTSCGARIKCFRRSARFHTRTGSV